MNDPEMKTPGPTALKIAAAGLLHDIGKFAGPGVLEVSESYQHENRWHYQAINQYGHEVHLHALHTAAFLQDPRVLKLLPAEFAGSGWGDGDSLLDLAARHHRPRTAFQQILAEADRIASGWDREGYAELARRMSTQDFLRTRLEPLLEHLGSFSGEQRERHEYFYPLKEAGRDSIFPIFSKESDYNTGVAARQEYKELFDRFLDCMSSLAHLRTNLPLWFENFDSLLWRFTSSIPADRAGLTTPDVSLYDHSRVVAVLACALYLYHRHKGTLNTEDVKANDEAKFLIINGQFYNIHDFLFKSYGDATKSVSKLLLGRSMAVGLISELASDLICRQLGLPHICVLKSFGGHFLIVAPNTPEARDGLSICEENINNWLLKSFYNDNAVSISSVEGCAADFVKGRFKELFAKLANRSLTKKTSFGGYGDVIGAAEDAGPVCRICAQRPPLPVNAGEFMAENLSEESFFTCGFCRDHIYLGSESVRKRKLAVFDARVSSAMFNRLAEPILGIYQIYFFAGDANEFSEKKGILRTWDLNFERGHPKDYELAVKFIRGHVPTDDNPEPEKRTIRTFAEIAGGVPEESAAPGLATLRADVDDLAALLKDGLPSRQFTLARLAHLSRHFNSYFVLFVGELIRKSPDFRDVFTVFAGGDDLFLIGALDRIFEIAVILKNTFGDFASGNPAIHLSAALTVHGECAAMEQLAGESMQELLAVKSVPGKNLIRVLGQNLDWTQFENMIKVADRFETWTRAGRLAPEQALRLLEAAAERDPAQALERLRAAAGNALGEMELSKIAGWGGRHGGQLAVARAVYKARQSRCPPRGR